jgi:hypothetical protein
MEIATTLSLLALGVSLFATIWAYRNAVAAERAADASQASSRHAEVSAGAAETSNTLTRRTFEDDAKRVKGKAYWALYRCVNRLIQDPEFSLTGIDLSAVEEYLSVYGHTLEPNVCDRLRSALNGIDLVVSYRPLTGFRAVDPEFKAIKDRVYPYVRDAAMSLREDWYPIEQEEQQ